MGATPRITLIVGPGGREHAIGSTLSQQGHHVLYAPGNGGVPQDRRIKLAPTDIAGIVAAARSRGVDIVVVGPEVPLVAGLVDALTRAGIPAFGPSAACAQLEASKSYTKELCRQLHLPTASYKVATSFSHAVELIRRCPRVPVIKADGLAAGKGVIIPGTCDEAVKAAYAMLEQRRFGIAGASILIEDNLVWGREEHCRELSLMFLCDGRNALALPPVRDCKRAFDNDEGPNTGGMGGYSPVPAADVDMAEELRQRFALPILEEMNRRGHPYHGVLYLGFMMTPDGPYLLEINTRFGDPETQIVMPRLEDNDWFDIFLRSTRFGGLDGVTVNVSNQVTVGVVIAASGYPETFETGFPLGNLEAANRLAHVFHAGTDRSADGTVVAAGGRLLTIVGSGDAFDAAHWRAYAAAGLVSNGTHTRLRMDIAARMLTPA
jgi:phosphoribosylamine--glycine ligase